MHDLTTRQQLAEARIALRLAQDVYDLAKAQAAQRIIDAAGGAKGLGANAEDRDRALTITLAADEECMTAEGTVRTYQAQVDRLQAQLDDEIDVRRSLDRVTRDRLSTALEALAIQAGERNAAISILATPQAA
jgi:hypothetical protein